LGHFEHWSNYASESKVGFILGKKTGCFRVA